MEGDDDRVWQQLESQIDWGPIRELLDPLLSSYTARTSGSDIRYLTNRCATPRSHTAHCAPPRAVVYISLAMPRAFAALHMFSSDLQASFLSCSLARMQHRVEFQQL